MKLEVSFVLFNRVSKKVPRLDALTRVFGRDQKYPSLRHTNDCK